MRKSILLLAVAMLISSALAQVRIPAGYELIQITDTPYKERDPAMNNLGQIVFEGQVGGGWDGTELFLYDTDGSLTQLTDDNVWDGTPDIADDGTIVWSKAIGDGDTDEIMVRSPNGEVTRLTFDDLDDGGPTINNLDQIAWTRFRRLGCANFSGDVMLFDGQTIQQLTNNLWSNQGVRINDAGEIVWTEYDLCPAGNWVSLIKLYRNGTVTTLSEPGFAAGGSWINNHTVCMWNDQDPVTFADRIYLWENGVRTIFTDGEGPHINDRGDVYFIRQHGANGWQGHLFLKGEFYQLTDDPFWNTLGDINNKAEVVWLATINWPNSEIRYLRRMPAGDLNCDGALNGADIDPFFLALGDPAGYRSAHPDCDWTLADVNGDGFVNGADIDAFFAALGG